MILNFTLIKSRKYINMNLYSLTLKKSSMINQAIYGNFSSPKAQELVISRGKFLELLRPDENTYLFEDKLFNNLQATPWKLF